MNRSTKFNLKSHPSAVKQISNLTPVAALLDIKDRYTREHALRVAIYARRLAERIGLHATAVENIRLGGLGKDFSRTYYVEQATHTINTSGYKTTFRVKDTTA